MSKLILGDGLLGSELNKKTGWDYISRKKDGIDFVNLESYESFLEPYDEIINCIAYTETYDTSKDIHWSVNFGGVVDLCDFCVLENKKLIHISTDYLYAHSKDDASELDVPVHCENWYGYAKLLADGYVQLKGERYLLIRSTHKRIPFEHEFAWINQVGNFDYVSKISSLIISLIDNGAVGIYNVGTELKSMYDLAKQTKSEVKPTTEMVCKFTPTNLSMNLDKMRELIK